MNRISRIVTTSICLLAAVAAQFSSANVIYTYTGNDFAQVIDDTPPAGTYTTSMNVYGMFELASALPANRAYAPVTPLSFSFTDGRSVITDSTPNLRIDFFDIQTDASGNIIHWNVAVISQVGFTAPYFDMRTTNCSVSCPFNPSDNVADVAEIVPILSVFDQARINDSPGTWAQTPAPGAISLLSVGLIVVAWSRRFRRATPGG